LLSAIYHSARNQYLISKNLLATVNIS
jgi:hypothetical protein